jgi:hypothetical protein
MACQPIDVFDYAHQADQPFDMIWVEWLEGAIITGVTWEVDQPTPAVIEIHDESVEDDATTARVWVRGTGVDGQAFVTAVITASDGRTEAKTWQFNVC